MTQLGIATDLQALLSLIDPKGLTLLEAGCGDGSLARQLVGQGATVMGLEPDPVQATKNAQAEPMVGLSFHESPADQMPLEDASVHGVIFSLSLHHIPKPLMGPSLREAHRVLKPGGFLAVVEPIADGSNNHVMELFHDEREVRDVAIEALERDAAPLFEQRQQYFYTTERRFGRFEDFTLRYLSASYNSLDAAIVTSDAVRERFEANRVDDGYLLHQPMRIDFFSR